MNIVKSFFFLGLLCFLFTQKIYGQNVKDSVIFCPLVQVNLAAQAPEGDLKDYFGINSNIGCSIGIKNKKNQSLELNYNFIHSRNVKYRAVLDHLLNDQGWIINQHGEQNFYVMYQRGGIVSLDVGKIFPFFGPNPNSGIHLKTGLGFMFHKIRIEHEQNLVPQLQQQYLPYYDRFTMGTSIKEYVGYHHMSNNNLVNFTIGLECIQGFTRGMRDYQIDLMGPYHDQRIDIFIGIRAGWIFPVFRKAPDEYYYN